MDEKNLQQAQKMYQTLCNVLDERQWPYEKTPDKLMVDFSGKGEDLPLSFRIRVDAQRQLMVLYSMLPFKFPEDRITQAAVATMYINDSLLNGSFDLDITDGSVCFRVSNLFRDSLISPEAFHFLLEYSIHFVDEYNDKLFGLAKGMINLEQLFDAVNS